jgi:hypothetical protein
MYSSSTISLDTIDRTLIEFSNNNCHSNSSSMSAATAARSPFHPHVVSEESYCAPWDLKTQEEKLKLLSEQRTTPSNTITSLTDALLHPSDTNRRSISSSSINNNPFHRTRSARTTSFCKKPVTICEPSPPLLPPLPPGGLIPPSPNNIPCQCGSNSSTRTRTVHNQSASEILDPSLKKISYCLNAHAVRSGTDTSRSFVFSSSSPSTECSHRVNTAPAKVDLSSLVENRSESNPITSRSSATSLLSTASSSSIESPLINDETKPISFEVCSSMITDYVLNRFKSFSICHQIALQRFKRLSSSTRHTSITTTYNNNNNNNNNEHSSDNHNHGSSHVCASSLPKPYLNTSQESSIAYERPWDTLQTSLINSLSSPPSSASNRSGDSLQKMMNIDESKQPCLPPFPMVSPTLTTGRQSTCSPEDRSTTSSTNTGGNSLDNTSVIANTK